MMLDQEKMCFEKEKFRVQTLLNGMQDVMNGYNSGLAAVAAAPTKAVVVNSGGLVPYVDPAVGPSAGTFRFLKLIVFVYLWLEI